MGLKEGVVFDLRFEVVHIGPNSRVRLNAVLHSIIFLYMLPCNLVKRRAAVP